MGKYYCDYCDIYLTHDSMSARKAHNTGRNHVANVRDYFAGLNHDKAQNIIDQILSQHEGGGGGGPGGPGGRQQMMMAPSMRLGAGFLNPMTTQQGFPNQPPFPPQQSYGAPPPQQGFRPPFPPQNGGPPFPPPNFNGGPPPFPPSGQFNAPPGGGFRPPPPSGPGFNSPPGSLANAPPPTFTQASQPPAGAAPGIHPDRLRMLGNR